jgi:hypothetical protein
MSDVINLSERQKPVKYTLEITQHYDGTVEAFVRDVSDDARSMNAVISALLRVVEARLNRRVGHAGDAMLAVMLANIDHAMDCTEDNPAVFKVGPKELSTWVDAAMEYEQARFPLQETSNE